MSKKAVVRLDNMTGTIDGSQLFSGIYHGATGEAAIQNGSVVNFNSIIDNYNGDLWKVIRPKRNTARNKVALVASVETFYEDGYKALDEFENKAGNPIRLYTFVAGNIFSVTKEALDIGTSATVGQVVELQDDDVQFKVVNSLTSGSTEIGTIIRKDVVGSQTFYVIRVS